MKELRSLLTVILLIVSFCTVHSQAEIMNPARKTAWWIIGNAGTNDPAVPATYGTTLIGATENWAGTIDAQDYVIGTNNIERMRVQQTTGNVGIGSATPAYRLDLGNGTFGFGNSNVRTEWRDNAGLQGSAGAQSGFFETVNPANYPTGASSWWHLIDTRHSNSANNYALQIAGSFFDQDLWFRKTNGAANTAWSKLLTTTTGWALLGNAGTNASTNFIGTTDAVDWVVRTSNAERLRVLSGGNVGIGIAAPTEKLDVAGNVKFSGALMPNNLPGAAGNVLVSSGAGVAPTWQPPSNVIQTYASATAARTSITVTQPTYTDITNLTVTFTLTKAAYVYIFSTGALETFSSSWGGSGCLIRIERNGTFIPNGTQVVDVNDASGWSGTILGWSIITTENLPAGTYTYKVRAAKYAFDGFYAGGNTTAPAGFQNNGSLVVQVFYQ